MKKWRYPPFKCSSEFPARIPPVLESRGLVVQRARWLSDKPSPTQEFGYEVSDGQFIVVVTGGTLPDGATGYRVAHPPFEWSLKFWQRSKKEGLRVRVQQALGESGGQLWADYPYD